MDAAVALEKDAAALSVPALPSTDGAAVVAFFEECRDAGEMLHLVIADAMSDAYLGEVMLVVGDHGVGELGCAVVPSARGRGMATEALRIVARWSFDVLGLGRLEVFVAPENHAALRLVDKAGFQREGVLRDYWENNGERLDMVVLSLLPGDPRAQP